MVDPNPPFIYALAKRYSSSPKWYRRHKVTSAHIAHLVDALDYPLIRGRDLSRLDPKELQRNMHSLMSVILRWWVGCLNMAKVIALETRDGPNTPEYRNRASRHILRQTRYDRVYADGVRAALNFKMLRKQPYSTEGITSPVLAKLFPGYPFVDPRAEVLFKNKRIKSKKKKTKHVR